MTELRQYLVAPTTPGPLTDPEADLRVIGTGELGGDCYPILTEAYWLNPSGPAMKVHAVSAVAALDRVRAILRTDGTPHVYGDGSNRKSEWRQPR